ncbi:MAG: hypothetical protein N4A49_03965 [Marinifilaceae bacterium]|jgi:hypothetical protein|nr:hypothetical protein [Marinifilaceae bacterium]
MRKFFIITCILLYSLTASTQETSKQIYLGLSSGLHNPIGLKFGVSELFKNGGLYINLQAGSTDFDLDYTIRSDNRDFALGLDKYFEQTGKDKIESYMMNIGATYKITNNFGFYAGVGYGKYLKTVKVDYYKMNNQYLETLWCKDKDSCSGLSSEFGLLLQCKNILLSTGVSNIKLDRYDLQFSIAYLF